MKLVAHRGWSAGPTENSLAAFARAAGDPRIEGVEFDVRRGPDRTLVVSHDPPRGARPVPLKEALSFLADTNLELFIELKEPGIAAAAVDCLLAAGVAQRAVIFAFPAIAHSFPWHAARTARLGIIVLYPWTIGRVVRAYRPDVLLLGWDERPWTRLGFRAWCSVFSLRRLGQRCARPLVVGVVQQAADAAWLAQQGVYAAVADMDRIAGS